MGHKGRNKGKAKGNWVRKGRVSPVKVRLVQPGENGKEIMV